jgi:hypothetical protein
VNTVGDQDIGVYECRASNPAGIAVDYANVQYASKSFKFLRLYNFTNSSPSIDSIGERERDD